MRLFRIILLAAPATCLLALSGVAQTNAEPSASPRGSSPLDFATFRLIIERNIFNPNRSARGDESRNRRAEPDRAVRADSFSLLGTMSYEKGRFAFFDGSSPDYRKVLQPEGSIAGFKVASVAPNCVRLEGTDGRTVELCVGMRMSKREQEEWRVSEAPADSSGTNGAVGREKDGSSGGEDEIVKRLMQRRDQDGGAPAEPASTEKAAPESKPAAASNETDEPRKRLLQKREQELNK